MTTLATETWTGTTGAAWPAQWTSQTPANSTIQGNAGRQAPANGTALGCYLPGTTLGTTWDATATVSAATATGNAGMTVGATWWADYFMATGYTLTVSWTSSSGNIEIRTTDSAASSTSRATASMALSAATTYNVRFQRVGGVLRGKVWTGTEPSTWTITWTDTLNLATHLFQLSSYSATAATQFTWDNLTVTDAAVGNFVSASGQSVGSAATTVAVSAPASIVAGNLLVAAVFAASPNSTPAFAAPSGWTTAGTLYSANSGIAVFTKVATGSEPTSYTFTGPGWLSAVIEQYSGTSGLDGTPQLRTGTSPSTPTTAAATATQTPDALLGFLGSWNGAALTTPSGTTLRQGTISAGNTSLYGFDAVVDGTGTTPTYGSGTDVGQYAAATVLLAPVGSGPVSVNLSGSGTLGATGTPKPASTASFSGSGTVAVTGTPKPASTATFSSTGTLSAQPGSAPRFSGTGALTTVPTGVAISTAVTFLGSGSFTASAPVQVFFGGSGALAGTGASMNTLASMSPSGEGQLGVSGFGRLWHFTGPAILDYRPLELFRPGVGLIGWIPYGKSVWKDALGQWHEKYAPDIEDLDGAQAVYAGGRIYPLTDAQRLDLIAGGYGNYITLEAIQ